MVLFLLILNFYFFCTINSNKDKEPSAKRLHSYFNDIECRFMKPNI